ncbi:MAG TPA: endonuclease/exonuclease/phosphatase family protein [Luteolibacter sp.]|nr:endonuclease/exonuclease/phosphatase family protein [Luteolibacter sp.]
MNPFRRLLRSPRCWWLLVGLVACALPWARWRPAQRFVCRPVAADELRVVTWNVGYFAPVSDKNMKATDVERVATLLKPLDADVVVLQELGSVEQAALIARELGPDWHAMAVPTGHGNQVLAVISDLPLEDHACFECGGRMAVDAAFEGPQGHAIRVVGVHAPHPARGVEANRASICGALERGLASDEQPCIVAGDMNINFDPEGADPFYQEITGRYGDSTASLGETYYAHTRIDHVFHTPAQLSVVERASGLIDLSPRLAMVPGFRDHRPIVVTYRMQ